jgi:hypothetical protein
MLIHHNNINTSSSSSSAGAGAGNHRASGPAHAPADPTFMP